MSTILPLVPRPAPALRLTGTRVAEYFRFACERQLRLELTPAAERGVARQGRPGAKLLSAGGRFWEGRVVRRLQRRLGPSRVFVAGWTPAGAPARIEADRVWALLREPGEVEVLVQPEIRLRDPDAFARRFGIDPLQLEIAPAVPDLLRIRRLPGGRRLLQVVDIKASAAARVPHFAQVAYYSLLLDELCRQEGWADVRADRRVGRIWSRGGGSTRFALAAYRHHVAEVLRTDLPRVAAAPLPACAWHLSARCGGCGYLAHCRAEADGRDDLARVVGLSPLAATLLRGRGLGSVGDLAKKSRRDSYRGCHALESQAPRLARRAEALTYGKVIDLEGRTHLMPATEDVRVVLTAEGDPVTARCFALGMRVEGRVPPGLARLGVWIADAGSREAERAMLGGLLASLERLLAAVAEQGRSSLHFYLYDRAELALLRDLLVRHLPDAEARPAIARLLRVVSPRAVTMAPDALRAAGGTLVADAVATLFALPVPYAYDLAAVSDRLRPRDSAAAWHPPEECAWPFSSQVAFERAHDLWRAPSSPNGDAAEARERIQQAVVGKLAAIDSVVRAVRERSARGQRLQMRKDPLASVPDEAPLREPALETLRVFTEMEAAAEAAAAAALHVLPAPERARRLECISGLSLTERRDDGTLVFEFDPACRDSKMRPGDFNLVLTNDRDDALLDADRYPWKRRALSVELVGYEGDADRPLVVLAPGSGFRRAEERKWIDLDFMCVLDRGSSDYATARLLATLRALDGDAGERSGALAMLRGETPPAPPTLGVDPDHIARELLQPVAARLGRPVLNADQQAAWAAALQRPLSVIWGPPGTGKTYLLAWVVLGMAQAARAAGRPLRVLVTAATHRAVANLLLRLDAECAVAGGQSPRLVKLRGSGSDADLDLAGRGVELLDDLRLPAALEEADASGLPLVVGSTVWSLWKQMRRAGRGAGEEDDGTGEEEPVAPWFDLVIVDEASQLRVAESMIALSSLRPGARAIFCGDDRQLAPVLRGSYPDDASTLWGSAFDHFAAVHGRLPLRESRRMNGALVSYPRRLFYPGLTSADPRRALAVDADPSDDPLLQQLFLHPADAVVLATYSGLRATARNPWEAQLAARIARAARRSMRDPATGAPYSPGRFVADGLAVISPHRVQNSTILHELRSAGWPEAELPVVDTVERMQGNEREMVIVSYGVADREYAESEAEFLLDPNRFNVATTRARAKLVVLVSEEVLAAVPTEQRVMEGSLALKGFVAHCRDGQRETTLPGPDGQPVRLRCRYRTLRD